ncbi:hypothetical protein CIK05_15260 [Bdellovibrio sp. qaytius]|nr:hypothetical protein CIK05_15260 [Bdellovibrio sp. qaytius]
MADHNKLLFKLTPEEFAEQERKNQMWDMRMAYIHSGHKSMQEKQYGDAVISFEKYVRTLELIFKVEPGNLAPSVFKENSRTSEMSILAGVLWDLVRIYDTSSQYSDRQANCAAQLAKIVPLTPISTEIILQAQEFVKNAKNPQNVKIFLAGVGKSSRCFIATSAYESSIHTDVMILRNYRDSVLKQSFLGRKFVYFYYRHSPKVACILDQHEYLKAPTRLALKLLIKCVR